MTLKELIVFLEKRDPKKKELTPDLLKYLIGETRPRRAESLYRQLFFFDLG